MKKKFSNFSNYINQLIKENINGRDNLMNYFKGLEGSGKKEQLENLVFYHVFINPKKESSPSNPPQRKKVLKGVVK